MCRACEREAVPWDFKKKPANGPQLCSLHVHPKVRGPDKMTEWFGGITLISLTHCELPRADTVSHFVAHSL